MKKIKEKKIEDISTYSQFLTNSDLKQQRTKFRNVLYENSLFYIHPSYKSYLIEWNNYNIYVPSIVHGISTIASRYDHVMLLNYDLTFLLLKKYKKLMVYYNFKRYKKALEYYNFKKYKEIVIKTFILGWNNKRRPVYRIYEKHKKPKERVNTLIPRGVILYIYGFIYFVGFSQFNKSLQKKGSKKGKSIKNGKKINRVLRKYRFTNCMLAFSRRSKNRKPIFSRVYYVDKILKKARERKILSRITKR